MALLVLENVTKRFGGLVAVDQVSLELSAGEAVGIVGPNGSGKTTLFNIISGVYPADQGKILFDGVDITRMPTHKRANLGLGRTFQIPRPFSSASVRENVAIGAMFGRCCHETSVDKAMDIADHYIEVTGLKAHRDKAAGKLTPVEKKMMEIARALAMKPRILMMDEAMAGMHPGDIDNTVSLIKKISREEHITIVCMVEHIMRAVTGFADRVIVMYRGAKLVDAPTAAALSDPRVIEVYLGCPEEKK